MTKWTPNVGDVVWELAISAAEMLFGCHDNNPDVWRDRLDTLTADGCLRKLIVIRRDGRLMVTDCDDTQPDAPRREYQLETRQFSPKDTYPTALAAIMDAADIHRRFAGRLHEIASGIAEADHPDYDPPEEPVFGVLGRETFMHPSDKYGLGS